MAEMRIDPENKNHQELLKQGVRAYCVGEYDAAVQALSQATELLVKEHGNEEHTELGEVYLYYGKALLELSRNEADALGEAVPKGLDEDDDEEGDDVEMEESGEKKENGADKEAEASKDEAAGAGEASGSVGPSDAASSSTDATAGPSSSAGEPTETTAEDDEPTDLQVAWEVLELAKKIFTRLGDEGRKNLAETLIALGEISLENEKFEDAVSDITQGLEIQKAILPADSRTLSESYYKLGIVYGTSTQLDQASECFEKALTCLRNKLAKLEATENKNVDIELEITDIKGLIPVIEEKVADIKDYKEEMKNGVSSLLQGAVPKPDSSSTNGNIFQEKAAEAKSSSTSSTTVNNISHLVKRKRPDDDKEGNSEDLKTVKKQVV